MRLPRVQFTVRTMTIAVAAAAISLAASNRVIEAYDSYRFQKGWVTCDVMSGIRTVDSKGAIITICLGSDFGLTPDEEVYIYRRGSKPFAAENGIPVTPASACVESPDIRELSRRQGTHARGGSSRGIDASTR